MTSARDYVKLAKYSLNPWEIWYDSYRQNWNNYEALSKLSNFDIVGIPAKFRLGELEAEENHRYWDDFSKNTGVSIDAIKYPIRSRIYSNYGFYGNAFNSSMLAVKRLYRW